MTWAATSRRAVVLTAITVLVFVGFAITYLTPITPRVIWHDAGGALTASIVLPFAAAAVIGGFIAARRPGNWVGWLILGAAAAFGIGAFFSLLGTVLLYRGIVAGRWVQLGGVLWSGTASPALVLYTLAVLLFPDGHLPSRWWRPLVWLSLGLMAVNAFVVLVAPFPGGLGITYVAVAGVDQASPFGVGALAGFCAAVANIATIGQLSILALSIVSVFLRLRGADSERRQQIKWFAAGVTVTAIGLFASNAISTPVNSAPAVFAVQVTLSLVAVLATPVAVVVAVLKYRLYDVDVIINRALVYGVLAVFITAVYVGIAVGIGALVGSGGKPNLGLSILATAIIAVGFQPLRQTLQQVANRLVYGRRATPYEVLSAFSGRVADAYQADDVLQRMAQVLRDGTSAAEATVWLRAGAQLRPMATSPEAPNAAAPVVMSDGVLPPIPGTTLAVPVRHQEDLLGALSVTKRRGDAVTPMERKLVEDLANQAGLVLRNVRLTADLRARLEDLRASRQRLVAAQDTERRRLERNLHDGAQQHLVAIKVKLGLAEVLTTRDEGKAREMLVQLKQEADDALETLRNLARGIYPPLLAEKGLPAALDAQARRATLPVILDCDGMRRHDQEVEATVYFCILEALQNAQKYASASEVRVTLRDGDGVIRFEVSDDGRGFDVDATHRGSGLTNMTDRLDAIGGTLEISSHPGQGTVLVGELPTATEPLLRSSSITLRG